jgi:ATP-dependent DNA helicase RecG
MRKPVVPKKTGFVTASKRRTPDRSDMEGWRRLLLNTDLLASSGGETCATVAGLLLFGSYPNRRLPQAGVAATAFPGPEKDYNTG